MLRQPRGNIGPTLLINTPPCTRAPPATQLETCTPVQPGCTSGVYPTGELSAGHDGKRMRLFIPAPFTTAENWRQLADPSPGASTQRSKLECVPEWPAGSCTQAEAFYVPTGNHPKAQRAEKGGATAPTEARRLLCMTRSPAKPRRLLRT